MQDMELFPKRPRPTVSTVQLGTTCLILIVANLAVALWMANDAETRRRLARTAPIAYYEPGPGVIRADSNPIPPIRVKVSPWLETFRYLSVVLLVNISILAGLGYLVMARYLEALRRYNLCIPTGFDEHQLKQRHLQRQSMTYEGGHSDDPLSGSVGTRFDW